MNILILEDEKIAADRIQSALKKYYDEVEIIWLQSIVQGIEYLSSHQPDLILSDIELLDGKAFKIYESIDVSSPIIFTTAYDEYVLNAFQTNGIAYLLKPIQDDELYAALDKHLKMFDTGKPASLDPSIIQQLRSSLEQSTKTYKQRFTIKKANGIMLLQIDDINYFTADDNIVFAVDNQSKKHIVNHRMSELEEILDPSHFFRINRSEIIKISSIQKIEPYFNNRLCITVNKVTETFKTSGPKTASFRKWIEGDN